jgi:hypothetical protein
MISPKEQAIELVNKFEYAKKYSNSGNAMSKELAKECALIAVNKILESNPTLITCNTSELNYAYWIEVKNQINQL